MSVLWRNKTLLRRRSGSRPQTAKAMIPMAGINWRKIGFPCRASYDLVKITLADFMSGVPLPPPGIRTDRQMKTLHLEGTCLIGACSLLKRWNAEESCFKLLGERFIVTKCNRPTPIRLWWKLQNPILLLSLTSWDNCVEPGQTILEIAVQGNSISSQLKTSSPLYPNASASQ